MLTPFGTALSVGQSALQWEMSYSRVCKRFEDIPVEVLDFIDGYVFLAENAEFIAKNLVSRLKQYAEPLKTPFFGALVDYAEEAISSGPVPATMAAFFIAAAQSAGFSWNILAKRFFVTTSITPFSNSATF